MAVPPLLARTVGQACRQINGVWSIDGLSVGSVCAIGRRANGAGLDRIERCEGSLLAGGERSRLSGWLPGPRGGGHGSGLGDGLGGRWLDGGYRSPATLSGVSITFLVEDWDGRCAWWTVGMISSEWEGKCPSSRVCSWSHRTPTQRSWRPISSETPYREITAD